MVSSHHLGKIAHKFHAMKARVDGIKEKAEETMGQVLQTAEIAAAAGGFAYANGRFGNMVKGHATPEITVIGVPADVGAAVVLHGMGFAGALGKYKEHAHNLGDGALASFLVRTGLTMGAAKRSAPPRAVAGAFEQQANPWSSFNPSAYNPGHQSQAVGSPWQGVG